MERLERFLNALDTLIAWLNDLLQLDHDAIAAYGLALKELDSAQLRRELEVHLSDHTPHSGAGAAHRDAGRHEVADAARERRIQARRAGRGRERQGSAAWPGLRPG